VCEVEGVGVIIELTRAFSALFTLLAPHMVSGPWVSDFFWPKVVYTNRYTNAPRTGVNK
jgi:hypothetical protein